MKSILNDSSPLQSNYLPRKVVDRSDEQEVLETALSSIKESSPRNLHLHGPRGTGKTHLTHLALEELPDRVNTCYVPCHRYDSQYKALKQVCRLLTADEISDGHHTSTLQRKLEEKTETIPTVIILDEIDFLLLNDGDDLLYYLSRIKTRENVAIITISANYQDLASQIEERTYSSLHPTRIGFEPYTAEENYRILIERAQKALTPQSLHREALTYIASATTNASLSINWLKTAAENADQKITEATVKEAKPRAYQHYADNQLKDFSDHHSLLYQAVNELSTEQEDQVIQTGAIYQRYQDLSKSYSEKPLSDRRISDFLKHLELLDLVEAEYHYGGSKGKTREIKLHSL